MTRNGVLLNKYDKARKIVEYCLEGVNIINRPWNFRQMREARPCR